MPRLIGEWLSDHLGQPFIVENKPRGSGSLATEEVVKAHPDGYTLLLLLPGNAAINASPYDKLSYDFARDLAPVAGLSQEPEVSMGHFRPIQRGFGMSVMPWKRTSVDCSVRECRPESPGRHDRRVSPDMFSSSISDIMIEPNVVSKVLKCDGRHSYLSRK